MPLLQIKDFSGSVPVSGDRALADNFAVQSVNTWLYGSELRGLRPPQEVIAVLGTSRRVMRIPKGTVGGDPAFPLLVPPPSYLGDSVWVQFTDPNTDIVRGQLVEDSFKRWYFCSPSTGPLFNTYARLLAGLPMYKLGVPGPVVSPIPSADTPTISNIVSNNVGTDIYEIEFKISVGGAGPTSYANAGGTGNRTASITVGGTVTFSGGAGSLLVDGNLANAGFKFSNLASADKTLQFDFGVNRIIDEFKWYQSDYKNYGNWIVQGSLTTAVWVDIGNVTLGGALQQAYAAPNTTAYRYYRLYQPGTSNQLMITRSYVYTWVNEYGEESTPSLPAIGAGSSDGVWTIGNIKDPPAAAGYANYLKKYLYRTITGTSGQTTFYRIGEVALGTLVYNDDANVMTDAVLASHLLLESTSWALPPSDLEGFVAMPNGYLIGFRGNDVFMSESYHFHAWPPEYKQASEYPIVGLGVLGNTCVVCTQGYPGTITGVKPAAASFTKATTGEPALGRGSIVSTPSGVLYASQNGLQLVGPGGINNVTEKIITREQWIKNYAPPYLSAVRYQNGYLALRALPTGMPRSGFYLDPTTLKVALTELSVFTTVDELDVDVWSGEVFLLDSAKIQRWDAPGSGLLPLLWLSKEFQFPYPENFGAYAIYWDQARYSNNAFGTDIMPSNQVVRLRVFANRAVVYDEQVPRNGFPVRLPSGFKSDIWQFEIRARAPVYSLAVAGTMRELRSA